MTEPGDVIDEEQREGRPVGHAERERALARFAGRRDAILTTDDLHGFGIGNGAIAHRSQTGRLHRIHRGVYSLGHPAITERGRFRAAVAAVGEGALLSHRSGARLWALPAPPGPGIEVTVASSRRRRRGIRVHRSSTLTPADRTEVDGIPVTSLPRTLRDLAAVVSPRELERAVIEAERLRILDVAATLEQCGRGRSGAAALREVLRRELGTAAATRSELENRFLRLCERFGIPLPEVNVMVHGFLVDTHWPAARLVVELDGDNYHRTVGDRGRDAARDRVLALAGIQVLRFRWDDVTARAETTAQAVLTMLASRTGRPER